VDLRFPELDPVPQDQRWAILTEAVRTVNATHGKMGRGPHYAGMALTAIVILPLVIMNVGVISAVFAGMARLYRLLGGRHSPVAPRDDPGVASRDCASGQ